MKNAIVTGFNMEKLEIEYDYDTDSEQIEKCKNMIGIELKQAIDFFVEDDPLRLIDNCHY